MRGRGGIQRNTIARIIFFWFLCFRICDRREHGNYFEAIRYRD